eukprot:1688902-Prymnesium_polylepis.1
MVAPACVPGYSNVRWYAKAEIIFVIAEAGTRRLRDFLQEYETRDYGDATRRKMISVYENKGTMLRLEIAGMLDMRKLVSTTYELEGDRLEILLVFDRLQMMRSIGNGMRTKQDGLLPNVDAVLRVMMELKPGVQFEKHFNGHGKVIGKLVKKEDVESSLYPGQVRPAWLCKYADGHEEHFEEEELRSGRDGPAPPPGQDGKPVLIVRGMPNRDKIYDAFVPGFNYLEDRLNGNCEANYSCAEVMELWRVVRAFNPNFAAQHLDSAFVDSMSAIKPLK